MHLHLNIFLKITHHPHARALRMHISLLILLLSLLFKTKRASWNFYPPPWISRDFTETNAVSSVLLDFDCFFRPNWILTSFFICSRFVARLRRDLPRLTDRLRRRSQFTWRWLCFFHPLASLHLRNPPPIFNFTVSRAKAVKCREKSALAERKLLARPSRKEKKGCVSRGCKKGVQVFRCILGAGTSARCSKNFVIQPMSLIDVLAPENS